MGNLCKGRVAIVTDAGRGLGRDYALMFAEQGAKVVINDLGSSQAGVGADITPAQSVMNEIKAAGVISFDPAALASQGRFGRANV